MKIAVEIADHKATVFIDGREIDASPDTLSRVIKILEGIKEHQICTNYLQGIIEDMDFRNPSLEKCYDFLAQIVDKRMPLPDDGPYKITERFPETKVLFEQKLITTSIMENHRNYLRPTAQGVKVVAKMRGQVEFVAVTEFMKNNSWAHPSWFLK